MNVRFDDTTPSPIHLTVEFRFANGASAEFQEDDEERVGDALRLLAAPHVFAQPHVLLASQHRASLIPCKGLDMILARTAAPLPLIFPLSHPAGLFDFVEQPIFWPHGDSAAPEDSSRQLRMRSSHLEIRTLGGWTVSLQAAAMFRGNVLDERQFFAHLPTLPSVPFRLQEGGFGLVNTANIVCVNASPRPEALPDVFLPLTNADGIWRS